MATDGSLLSARAIRLGLRAASRVDAIERVGRILLEIGAVDSGYVPAMLERERTMSTYAGEGIAIPHGTDESRCFVRRTALAVALFPDGVAWGGPTVRLCVGIAASGLDHLGILAALGRILLAPARAAELCEANDVETILRIFGSMSEDA